jgi:competence protein ComEA
VADGNLDEPAEPWADAPPGGSRPPAVVVAGSRWRVGLRAAIVLFLAALVIAVLVTAFTGRGDTVTVSGGAGSGTAVATPLVAASPSAAATPGAVVLVHVTGAVRHPGLYDLDPGSRLVDAVFAAGGFSRRADQSGVNLARVVADGEQIVVPRRGASGTAVAPATAVPGAPAGSAPGALVDLNTADLAALDTLPGIGPALAQRILDWRTANGGFTSVDQLLDVSGIGEATLADLQALVTV